MQEFIKGIIKGFKVENKKSHHLKEQMKALNKRTKDRMK
jgi:hypothetical protein